MNTIDTVFSAFIKDIEYRYSNEILSIDDLRDIRRKIDSLLDQEGVLAKNVSEYQMIMFRHLLGLIKKGLSREDAIKIKCEFKISNKAAGTSSHTQNLAKLLTPIVVAAALSAFIPNPLAAIVIGFAGGGLTYFLLKDKSTLLQAEKLQQYNDSNLGSKDCLPVFDRDVVIGNLHKSVDSIIGVSGLIESTVETLVKKRMVAPKTSVLENQDLILFYQNFLGYCATQKHNTDNLKALQDTLLGIFEDEGIDVTHFVCGKNETYFVKKTVSGLTDNAYKELAPAFLNKNKIILKGRIAVPASN